MPTPQSVHADVRLTNFSVRALQDDKAFIAMQVAPVFPVQKQSDKYSVIETDEFNKTDMPEVAPGTENEEIEWSLSDETYYCTVRGLAGKITDQQKKNADSIVQLEQNTIDMLLHRAKMNKESRFGTILTATTWAIKDTLANLISGAAKWNASGSEPVKNVRALRRSFLLNAMVDANTMVIARDVVDTLMDHSSILDRVKYSGSTADVARITKRVLQDVFEVENVWVMNAVQNSAKLASPRKAKSHSFLLTGSIWMGYVAKGTIGENVVTAFTDFLWSGFIDGASQGTSIRKFYHERKRTTFYDLDTADDFKAISLTHGALITDLI